MDPVTRLLPHLARGERVSVRAVEDGRETDVIGFVTAVDAQRIDVLDRRGITHRLARTDVAAGKRVDVARGRDPVAAPRPLLDALAARAASGAAVPSGTLVARISDLLAGRPAPQDVPAWGERAVFLGAEARVEGEWVTLLDAGVDQARAAAWWATRQGARSVQVRTDDPALSDALAAAGFTRR